MDVWFAMNIMIVPGMLVSSSFLISACMFIMSKVLLISSTTVVVVIYPFQPSSSLIHVLQV